MPLGSTFNRPSFENDVKNNIGNIIDSLNELRKLQARAAAELAAGTFDLPDWYGPENDPDGTNTRDKANIIGALNDAKALSDYLFSDGTVQPPANPLAYATFLF